MCFNSKENNSLYLHLGCGDVILPKPFINLDQRKLPGVDVQSSVYPLPFNDNTFKLVYSSHVLEHFPRTETLCILKEWVRVLKPGGLLRISVPSLERIIDIYQKCNKIENVTGPLMGGQTYDTNFHQNVFDTLYLTKLMKDAGLTAIHTWDYRRTIHADFFDFSQATTFEIPISLNLEGRKNETPLRDGTKLHSCNT
jgi:predicted SAM-dependent methyltransferase